MEMDTTNWGLEEMAEKTIETRMQTLVHIMDAMYVNEVVPYSHNSNSSFQSHSGASSISFGSGSSSVFPQNFGYGFNAFNSSNMVAPQSSFPQYGSSIGNGFQSSGNNFLGQELGLMVIMVTSVGIMVALNQGITIQI